MIKFKEAPYIHKETSLLVFEHLGDLIEKDEVPLEFSKHTDKAFAELSNV